MSHYTLTDFSAIPAGGEALPPEDSEYHRAVHLPSHDEARPWALIRGEGRYAVVDWVESNYLLVSGFTPADRLGMTFSGPKPGGDEGEQLTVRVAVDYPLDEGVPAWAVAKSLPDLVTDEDVFHRLVQMEDDSAIQLRNRLSLGGE